MKWAYSRLMITINEKLKKKLNTTDIFQNVQRCESLHNLHVHIGVLSQGLKSKQPALTCALLGSDICTKPILCILLLLFPRNTTCYFTNRPRVKFTVHECFSLGSWNFRMALRLEKFKQMYYKLYKLFLYAKGRINFLCVTLYFFHNFTNTNIPITRMSTWLE